MPAMDEGNERYSPGWMGLNLAVNGATGAVNFRGCDHRASCDQNSDCECAKKLWEKAVSRLISEAEKKAEEAREKLIMDTLRNYLKKDFWCEERDPINHPIGRVIGLLEAVKENQDGACLDVLEKAAKIVDGLCPKSGPLHTEDYGCLLCAQAAYHSAEIRALIRGKGEEGV